MPSANEVWGKVIFSEATVILFTGGGSAYRGSGSRGCVPTGGGGWFCIRGLVGQTPPPESEKRAVHILPECFLFRFETIVTIHEKFSNYLALWVLTTSCIGDVLLTVETLMFKAGLSSISSLSPLKRLTLPTNGK